MYFTTELYSFSFMETLNGKIEMATEINGSKLLDTIKEGSFVEVKVALQISVPLCEKMSFIVTNQGRTIIHGVITEVLG